MTGSYVNLKVPDGDFAAYVSRPAQQPVAGVIVIQEIFGVNPFVRETCDWLADNGYYAIAPDLFWRQSPGVSLEETDRETAMQLMQGLDQNRAVDDCLSAAAYLRGLPECTGKVSAVGYCLGGKLAYLLAARNGVDAAVSYYGVGIHAALGEAGTLRTALLLHIASQDALCPPAAQEEIVVALRENPDVSIRTYRAGHAFARTGSEAYEERSADRANRATLDFLATNL